MITIGATDTARAKPRIMRIHREISA